MLKLANSALALALIVLASSAHAASVSAIRDPRESFEQAVERLAPETFESMTATDRARPIDELNLRIIPELGDLGELERAFARMRDDRVVVLPEDPEQPRLISWRYPVDGCSSRATVASEHIESLGFRRPAKLFAFGALSASSESTGPVSWWYHVAPLYQVGGKAFVLDPAIDRDRPLEVAEWVARMSDTPSEVTLSVCNPFAYNPWSPCYVSGPSEESYAQVEAQSYSRISGD